MSFFYPLFGSFALDQLCFLYKESVQADFVTVEDSLHLTVEHVLKF